MIMVVIITSVETEKYQKETIVCPSSCNSSLVTGKDEH
jgi:hypothetical protein